MKKSIFALFALSVVTLGLSSCCLAKSHHNKVTIIETSENVTHPALHKGETLVFQIPKKYYVHFNPDSGQNPCGDKMTTLTWQGSNPPQCEVTADPKAASFYLYLINTDPHDISPKDIRMMTNSRKCPPWCPGTLVVAPASGQGETPQHFLPTQSDYPDVEVFIYKAGGVPDPVSAYPGQQITWFNTGTDPAPWILQFMGDVPVCQGSNTVKSANGGYCNVIAPVGSYDYTITVGTTPPGTTTAPTSHLNVVYPDVEVVIKNAGGVPDPASAFPGQQVNWSNDGNNTTPWSIQFKDINICKEGQTITSAKGGHCTIVAPQGSYTYTITIGTTTGPISHLSVIKPPDPPKPQ